MRAAALLLLLSQFALAQSPPTAHPEDLGTVTGHITCADTQRPARLAKVILVSTEPPDGTNRIASLRGNDSYGPAQTDLKGGYTIPNVPPGQYYLRVELKGYTIPIEQLSGRELDSPNPEIRQRIRQTLQLVNVIPNTVVQADAIIHRGGSISGTLRYDDGSPAINIGITALHHDANKDRGEVHAVRIGGITDSYGRFEIESLPPGEYVIQAVINSFELATSKMTSSSGETRDSILEPYSTELAIYSGSVFRYKDAAVIKLEAGQERVDADFSVPISQLHDIFGILLAKDGHSINAGQVELMFSGTRETLTRAEVHDDGTFHLAHVPEGTYILTVGQARDKTTIEIPHFPPPGSDITERILRTYGELERSLIVTTDIPSLNLTLPDKPATTASQ